MRRAFVDPDAHYEEAVKLLDQAEDQGFQNMLLVQQAHRLIEDALEEAPEHVPLLMLMAYVWYLMDANALAQAYVREVLTRDPQHEQARYLQQALAQQQHLSPLAQWQQDVQAFEALAPPMTESDYDFLYAETELFLQTQTRFFMQSELSPQVVLDAETVEAQGQTLRQIQHVQALIDKRLQCLNAVLETQPLERLNHPLKQIQKRFEDALWHNGVFQIIQDGCAQIQADAVVLLKSLKDASTALDYEQRLNQLLDACDSLADDLDGLSERVPIEPILPRYEETLRYVQHVQDTLDQRV